MSEFIKATPTVPWVPENVSRSEAAIVCATRLHRAQSKYRYDEEPSSTQGNSQVIWAENKALRIQITYRDIILKSQVWILNCFSARIIFQHVRGQKLLKYYQTFSIYSIIIRVKSAWRTAVSRDTSSHVWGTKLGKWLDLLF